MTLPASHPKKVAKREERQKVREEKAKQKAQKDEEKAAKKKIKRRLEVKQMIKNIGKYRMDEMEDALKKGLGGVLTRGNPLIRKISSNKSTANRISGKEAFRLLQRAQQSINGGAMMVRDPSYMKANNNMKSNFEKTFMTRSGLRNLQGDIDRVAGKLGVKGYSENSASSRAVMGAAARRTLAAMATGAIKNKTGQGIRTYARRVAMSIVESKGMSTMTPAERKDYRAGKIERAKDRKQNKKSR